MEPTRPSAPASLATNDASGSVYALFWANGSLDIDGHMVAGDDFAFWTVLVGYDNDGAYRFHRAEPLESFDSNQPNSIAVAFDGSVAVFQNVESSGSTSVDGQVYPGGELGGSSPKYATSGRAGVGEEGRAW